MSLKNHKNNALSDEPMINLPPLTLWLMASITFLHLGLWMTGYEMEATLLFGFIPARFTGAVPFEPLTLVTPLSYAFLHGGWFHICVNVLMLGALGAGFEKNFGGCLYALVYVGSVLISALVHFLLDVNSPMPMIGASGGISGLFGGLLLMLYKRGQLGAPGNFKKVLFVFIGVSVLFGFLGGPGGALIAWAAHVGGFIGGIGLTYFLVTYGRRSS